MMAQASLWQGMTGREGGKKMKERKITWGVIKTKTEEKNTGIVIHNVSTYDCKCKSLQDFVL